MEMDGKQRLYYALGEVCYAVAMADGQVQAEERNKIHQIVLEETSHHDLNFDVAEIIFHILKKDNMDGPTSYSWAMGEFERYKSLLTPDLVIDFVAVTEKVAVAFDKYEKSEKKVVNQFRQDLYKLIDV